MLPTAYNTHLAEIRAKRLKCDLRLGNNLELVLADVADAWLDHVHQPGTRLDQRLGDER